MSPSGRARRALAAVARPVGALAAASVVLLPLAVLTVQALSVRWFYPQVLPRTLTARPATDLLVRPRTTDAWWAGLRISVAVTIVALVAAWPAARLLAERSVRARGVIYGLLFLPSLLPAVGLAMGVNLVLLRLGSNGSTAAVVVAHLVPCLPYAVALLTAAFARHDAGVERQASLLGASPWQRFGLVTVPLLRRGLATAATLVFLVSWSQYLLTLLAGGGQVVTVTMLLFSALAGGNPTTIAALALFAAVPSLLALAVAGRSLQDGGRR